MTWRATAAALLIATATSQAQTVRGVVVDGANNPVAGVVVFLVDSSANAAARALTNLAGEYRLAAPRAGNFRLRTLRIGYAPMLSDPIELRAGESVDRRIVLSGARVQLDTVRVVDRNQCRTTGDSGMATFAVWEQVRGALAATQLTASARAMTVTTVRYARTMDAEMRHVRDQSARLQTGSVEQPWRSLSSDSLRRFGYVIVGTDDSTTYYAPGLDVLGSSAFVDDHCFHLVTSRDRRLIGMAFEPVPSRRQLADVKGTLWLDRATSELRRLEFTYVNAPDVPRDFNGVAGGGMDFSRMHDGGWVIAAWEIRMPLLTNVAIMDRHEVRMTGVNVTRGELVFAKHASDTLWSHPPLVLAGSIVDSASGRSIAGARISLHGTRSEATADHDGRFALPGLLYGVYAAEIRTPSLDSVGATDVTEVEFTDSSTAVVIKAPSARQVASALCRDPQFMDRDPPMGIVAGTVRQGGDTASVANIPVVAQWKEFSLTDASGRPVPSGSLHTIGARSDANGEYRICGVPANATVVVEASPDVGKATPDTIHIAPSGRFVRADLTIDAHAAATASLSGVVLADSTHAPIMGAEVLLPDVGRGAVTDAAGRFRIAEFPPGKQHIVVRRLGFAPLDTTLAFGANVHAERSIYLSRVVLLDSMVTKAGAIVLPGFDDHRKVGLGQFMTRAKLDSVEGVRLSTLLENLRGVRIVPGRGNISWLTTSHGPTSIVDTMSGTIHVPDASDRAEGAKPDCYAQVYVDGHLMFGRSRWDPLFDINSLLPSQIEAIEYYTGPAETPSEYMTRNSQCGVLVIWTRRTP